MHGAIGKARRSARDLRADCFPADPFYEATVYAVLHEDTKALDTLERAPAAKSDWMYSVAQTALVSAVPLSSAFYPIAGTIASNHHPQSE